MRVQDWRGGKYSRVGRVITVTILIAGSLYVTLDAGWVSLLRYERAAIAHGEWWRLVSGHLVHGSAQHWALNMLGLALVLSIFPHRPLSRQTIVVMLVLAVFISGGLYLFNLGLSWYVGLSGVLHGLFAFYVVLEMLMRLSVYTFAAMLLVVKITYEQMIGPATAIQAVIALPVVVDAHLYGAVGGLILALIINQRGQTNLRK